MQGHLVIARRGTRCPYKPGSGGGEGRGANLTLPGLPFTTPFTVQMQGSHGVCWEHVYNSAGVVRSDATQFKGNGG